MPVPVYVVTYRFARRTPTAPVVGLELGEVDKPFLFPFCPLPAIADLGSSIR